MLEKLTKEQEDIMIQTRDEWIDLFFNNVKEKKGINKQLFENGINWLYEELLNKPKPNVIYCDSWICCLITISILKNNIWDSVSDSVSASVRASVWDSVRDSVKDSVWDSVSDSVWASVSAPVSASVRASIRASIRASVWDSVRDSVRDSVKDSVRDSVSASVWDSVSASVRDSVKDSVWDSVSDSVWASVSAPVRASVRASISDSVWDSFREFSSYIDCSNLGWVSFYDFFEKINILNNNKFKEYKKLLKSGVFNAYEYENIVFAIQPPSSVLTDQRGRLHSTDDASVKFRDGSEYFYVHGVGIKEDIFNKLLNNEYKFDDFIAEKNEEVKSAILSFIEEKYGSESLFRFISNNLTELDTYIDNKNEIYLEGTTKGMNVGVYTLFKGITNNIELAFVRCYCPSTDRMFFLSVNPSNNSAKDAIASLYRIPKKLSNEIKYIQRQGERFSTVLTEQGNIILKSISKEDLSDLVYISGDRYFSLMRYEY